MGLKRLRSHKNPFSGKPIGTLVTSATIGNETVLADFMHNLRGLGSVPVACAGICLLDSVIGNMYRASDNEKIQEIFCRDLPKYEDNECAVDLARGVGKYVFQSFHSPIFQKIKHYVKL